MARHLYIFAISKLYTRRKQTLGYGLEKAGRCKEGEEMEKELQMAWDF